MATSDLVQAKIEAFARQLAEEFGEIDEAGALGWLDAIESRAVEIGDAVTRELIERKSAEPPAIEGESTWREVRQAGAL
jgi:hypothetical protein